MRFTKAIELHKNWTLIKNIGTNLWTVQENFEWFLDYEKKDYKIIVRNGTQTNFGSIPRFLWVFFNPTKYVIYVCHDSLYSSPYVYTKDEEYVVICKKLTRLECDLILLEWLTLEWASKLERICIYLWVRLGGWLFFKK